MSSLRVIPHFLALTLIVLITSVIGLPSPCPEDEYRDHGTGNCEHCSDICRFAEIQKTVETCLQLCPAYARKIGLGPKAPSDDKPEDHSSAPSHLPTEANAGIAIAVTVAGVCFIVLLAVFNRDRIRYLLKRPHPPAAVREHERAGRDDDASVPSLGTVVMEELEAVGTGSGAGRVPRDQDKLLRSLHYQESSHGRHGNYELAVNGNSTGSSLNDENVELKTFHDQGAPRAAPGMATSQD